VACPSPPLRLVPSHTASPSGAKHLRLSAGHRLA
jgi:hypothetical protein